MKIVRRIDWYVLSTLLFVVGCSGNGCGGCLSTEPIPGGFPAAKRNANAAQLRVTPTGISAIEADPAGLLSSLTGGTNGTVQFNVPAACGGSTPICCPGGQAMNPCGPIDIDLTLKTGDLPRLEIVPVTNTSTMNVTVRARIKAEQDIPVKVPVIGDCLIHLDSNPGAKQDLQITLPIALPQDGTAGTTKLNVGAVALANLTTDDVSLKDPGGGFGCALANLGLSFFLDTLTSTLTDQIKTTIQDQTCKKCPSGQVAECGSSFATACTGGVCQEGATGCLQELGIDGRMRGSSVFGSFSPGTTGALDLYMVAGGYATTNNNGIALGLLGGMEPGGAPRDVCGPPGTEPAPVTIPQSTFFQGNTRPDTGAQFDVAFGLHKSQLAQFAFAGYTGGLLCLTIGHGTVSQLTTDTIGILSRSLTKLVPSSAPMAVGLRPQSAPTIVLGKNTFIDDGSGGKVLDQPLLDIKFTGMEIDFFADIDDQYIRVFTIVSDVHLPIGLQTSAMGTLTPVIGNPNDAFTNLSVKNSEALTESPEELAGLFPQILGLVLPQLSGGLGSISLPQIGSLAISVSDITSVDNDNFLAVFGNLVTASGKPAVKTTASIVRVNDAPEAQLRDPKQWRSATPPSVELELGGNQTGLEWSWRLDSGAWSAWSQNAHPRIASGTFWLAGTHGIEVRSRVIGQPETIDVMPVSLKAELGAAVASMRKQKGANFHGAGNGGCDCNAGSGAGDAAPFALVIGMMLMPLRRIRRRVRAVARGLVRLGPVVLLTAILSLPGCSCSNAPECHGDKCGLQLDVGAVGRYTSIAADSSRVMVATYSSKYGDLVAVDVTDPANMSFVAVDGVPADGDITYDPNGFRGGREDPGSDVGAWTSIGMRDGNASIAYQDIENHALKFAREISPGSWTSYVVDGGNNGEAVGAYASMIFDGDGHPAIAYIAVGTDDGMGHRVTELRLARASQTQPSESDWNTSLIASAPGTCAGLCGAGESCAAPGDDLESETCVTASTDCTAGCGADEVCVTGTCHATIADPTTTEMATGTGLFVSLVTLPDGRLAAAFYDRTRRSLVLDVENGVNANEFTETVLDGGANGDRGMWASAAVDGGGTVHIAYQDALGDQLMYTTWNGNPGTPEVVDDGTRTGDRTHTVGASAALYLVNDAPNIAYQDGLTADVYLATKGGAAWSTSGILTGPTLDGFSIAVTTGHGTPVMAWDSLDPTQDPVNTLAVQSP